MKKFLALILALVMALSLVACGGSKTEEPAKTDGSTQTEQTSESEPKFEKQTWKFACSATENTCWADMGRDFGQMVSDATDGAITVEVYAADQLTAGVQTEGIQGVIDGTIELSAHSNIIYSGFDESCMELSTLLRYRSNVSHKCHSIYDILYGGGGVITQQE